MRFSCSNSALVYSLFLSFPLRQDNNLLEKNIFLLVWRCLMWFEKSFLSFLSFYIIIFVHKLNKDVVNILFLALLAIIRHFNWKYSYAKLFNNVDFRIDLASFCILLSDSQSVFTTYLPQCANENLRARSDYIQKGAKTAYCSMNTLLTSQLTARD